MSIAEVKVQVICRNSDARKLFEEVYDLCLCWWSSDGGKKQNVSSSPAPIHSKQSLFNVTDDTVNRNTKHLRNIYQIKANVCVYPVIVNITGRLWPNQLNGDVHHICIDSQTAPEMMNDSVINEGQQLKEITFFLMCIMTSLHNCNPTVTTQARGDGTQQRLN